MLLKQQIVYIKDGSRTTRHSYDANDYWCRILMREGIRFSKWEYLYLLISLLKVQLQGTYLINYYYHPGFCVRLEFS
jgi:CTP synthase (UTP-ammonia lyase)